MRFPLREIVQPLLVIFEHLGNISILIKICGLIILVQLGLERVLSLSTFCIVLYVRGRQYATMYAAGVAYRSISRSTEPGIARMPNHLQTDSGSEFMLQ